MSNVEFSTDRIRRELTEKLARYFGVTPDEANKEQIYKATILTVKDILAQKRAVYKEQLKKQRSKNVYYLCMEFLIGRSLKNNLMNLELADGYRDVLHEMGVSLDELYDMEPDPGLGNGGLGRLAACFMDSLTTMDYPATGFSICYEYGLFRQKIIDGNQVELPDAWLNYGDVWLMPRTDKAVTVRFGGHVQENWESGRCTITHTDFDALYSYTPCTNVPSIATAASVGMKKEKEYIDQTGVPIYVSVISKTEWDAQTARA